MEETQYSERLKCLHCLNESPMEVVSDYDDIDSCGENYLSDEGTAWQLVKCPACYDVMLRSGYWHSQQMDYISYDILYPSGEDKIRGLPKSISKAYEAALRVKPIDTNAFAVLLGRLLDLICEDKNAVGDNLYEKLQFLSDKGIMPSQLADMAHAIRNLRNIGAHANLGELTSQEVPILHDLCKAVLEYVYSAPELILSVEDKIKNLKSKPNKSSKKGAQKARASS